MRMSGQDQESLVTRRAKTVSPAPKNDSSRWSNSNSSSTGISVAERRKSRQDRHSGPEIPVLTISIGSTDSSRPMGSLSQGDLDCERDREIDTNALFVRSSAPTPRSTHADDALPPTPHTLVSTPGMSEQNFGIVPEDAEIEAGSDQYRVDNNIDTSSPSCHTLPPLPAELSPVPSLRGDSFVLGEDVERKDKSAKLENKVSMMSMLAELPTSPRMDNVAFDHEASTPTHGDKFVSKLSKQNNIESEEAQHGVQLRYRSGSGQATVQTPEIVRRSRNLGLLVDDKVLFHPPEAAEAAVSALRAGSNSGEPPVVAPLEILRAGCSGEDIPIEYGFVGAILSNCVRIVRPLRVGVSGRGWEGVLTDAVGGETSVFVLTFGSRDSVVIERETGEACQVAPYPSPEYADQYERLARRQAEVYVHPWFPAAADHIGATFARLCHGTVQIPFDDKLKAVGSIFFTCGRLCLGGSLLQCQLHKMSFSEQVACRIFGQLARCILTLKNCGSGRGSNTKKTLTQMVRARRGDYNCKITDYGSLRFTDSDDTTDIIDQRPPSTSFQSPKFIPRSTSSDRNALVRRQPPATADNVWSAGAILLFMVAGDHLRKKLGNDVYRFFKFALQPRNPEWLPDSKSFHQWKSQKKLVADGNLFFESDPETGLPTDTDERGIPRIQRKKNEIPEYRRFWEYMGSGVTDRTSTSEKARMPFSPELKDLLSRMLDVDPLKRITIEEVVKHPWLQKFQSPDMNIPLRTWETEEQRTSFVAAMKARTQLLMLQSAREHTFIAAATLNEAAEIVERCAAALGMDYLCISREEPKREGRRSSGLASTVECFKSSPTNRSASVPVLDLDGSIADSDHFPIGSRRLGTVVVTCDRDSSEPGTTISSIARWHTDQFNAASNVAIRESIFTVEIYADVWRAHWEKNPLSATLGEWHSFVHSIESAICNII